MDVVEVLSRVSDDDPSVVCTGNVFIQILLILQSLLFLLSLSSIERVEEFKMDGYWHGTHTAKVWGSPRNEILSLDEVVIDNG